VGGKGTAGLFAFYIFLI